MDSKNSSTLIKVIIPNKIPKGSCSVVLDNKIGVATTTEGYLPEITVK